MLLKRVIKSIITTVLRGDHDAVEGLISDDSFEIISQSPDHSAASLGSAFRASEIFSTLIRFVFPGIL